MAWDGLKERYFLYDTNGDFVRAFVKKIEIQRFLGLKGAEQIINAIRNPEKKVRSYYIRTVQASNLSEILDYTPVIHTNNRLVSSYDAIDGNLIATYPTYIQAARENGFKTESAIRKATIKQYTLVCGRYWRNGAESQIDVSNIERLKDIFYVIDTRTNESVGSFASISDASQYFSICRRNIKELLAGRTVKDERITHLKFIYYNS